MQFFIHLLLNGLTKTTRVELFSDIIIRMPETNYPIGSLSTNQFLIVKTKVYSVGVCRLGKMRIDILLHHLPKVQVLGAPTYYLVYLPTRNWEV